MTSEVMLDGSVFLGTPLAAAAGGGSGGGGGSASSAVAVEVRNKGGGGTGEEEGDRNLAGNRWPRQETEALLKIRSDMDQSFRESILKAPLWDEVSRKLAELGYIRNGKKCKEKFENIYKYHKRTKDGRSSRRSGKSYHFFQQLEIFESQNSVPSTPLEHLHSLAMDTTPIATQSPLFRKMTEKPMSSFHDFSLPCSTQDHDAEFTSASTSTASSSGRESEGNVKKKRKLVDYFQSLLKEVLAKQEDLQKKFLEVMERSERDRIAREESWKVQEIARIKREQEILASERALAAAKDAAVLSFLQKISEQNSLPVQMLETLSQLLDKPSEKQGDDVFQKQFEAPDNITGETCIHIDKQLNSAGENTSQSSSRWPKAEVEALILLKSDLELGYQDNGGKGTVWEDISSCMKKLGYDRNAKRCKEKWENINKYYKRVKESNKKRPEYSKTCQYFNMLESVYAKRSKKAELESGRGGRNLKPEQILMQMMSQQRSKPSRGEYAVDELDPDDYDEVEQVDDGGGCYQVVANDPTSVLLE